MKKKQNTKLGRNPFENPGRSQVGRIIEASFDKVTEPVKVQERGLVQRIQDMKISLDLRLLLKSIRT